MTVLTPRFLCWVIVGLLLSMALTFLVLDSLPSFAFCLVMALSWLRVAYRVRKPSLGEYLDHLEYLYERQDRA